MMRRSRDYWRPLRTLHQTTVVGPVWSVTATTVVGLVWSVTATTVAVWSVTATAVVGLVWSVTATTVVGLVVRCVLIIVGEQLRHLLSWTQQLRQLLWKWLLWRLKRLLTRNLLT